MRALTILLAALQTGYEFLAFRRVPDDRRSRSHLPKRFAERLIHLGPLFVKIGQILSTRPDLVPKEYVGTLQSLQERVPPMALEEACFILCQELHCEQIHDAFQEIEEQPIASASLAQVHLGTLRNGTPVAVKVQRLDAARSIRRDLHVLKAYVRVVAFLAPRLARNFNLKAAFEEFARYTLAELDFRTEASTMRAFRKTFAGWPDVVIPEPYDNLTTERVLTMERVSGMRVDAAAMQLGKEERAAVARRLMEVEMKMFISDGLFHADLHPGNVFFTEDRRIVLLDFGMYGRLTQRHRDHFLLYWFYGLRKDTRGAFRHLIAQTTRQPWADEAAYYRCFKTFAAKFYDSTITGYSLTRTYLDIISAGAKYGFIFPSDLLLQAKALTTAEALMFVLAPDLRFEQEAEPIVALELIKRLLDTSPLSCLTQEALPELLLFGKLPIDEHLEDDDGEGSADESRPVLSVLQNSSGAAILVDLLRPLVERFALPILLQQVDSNAGDVLADAWQRYYATAAEIPTQSRFGAAIMVRLASLTAEMYRAVLAREVPPKDAMQIIYEIAWAVYRRMGSLVWSVAGTFARDDVSRMKLATGIFRTFPFSAPSYGWQDVMYTGAAAAFDCLECPVAAFLEKERLSELCVATWCALDFPLAELWQGRLERTGSIAGGARRCDFRWFAH